MLQAVRPIEPVADTLDSALIDLARYGPEMTNGFTTHAPMVAEALDVLGRGDAIADWIERHRAMMMLWPDERGPILDWRAALGRAERVSDWRALFRGELTERHWPEVLARWVPRLAPGASAAALHGLIRVGHAARALSRAETQPRLDELASALASWASEYSELQVASSLGAPQSAAETALSRLPFLPADRRRNGGSIVAALQALDEHPPFARAFHWPAIEDAEASARELADLFARIFLANVDSPLHAIVFTHAITGTAAVMHLLPLVREAEGGALVRHVWHAGCGLYAAYGTRPPASAPEGSLPRDLIDRAVANGDDHVIKLTEAVLALELEPALAGAVSERAMAYL
ncbi:questin oxidase family protein [Sphingomonas tabacisoli]|uniref:Questin oxidase family protein n=1 Tax=Sphingomonas tabacisoli TaxID=2249466 RepID=A0ABW4I0G2_9SPHN